MATNSGRNMHLAGGRRVRLHDLVEEGLLAPGAELFFNRKRVGEVHVASVTPEGRLRLEDSREFSTPSRAARAATDGGSFDGWTAWAVRSSGKLLDDLRQEYLEGVYQTPAGSAAGTATTSEADERHAFLKDAREAAYNKTPRRLAVRELLAHWDSTPRAMRDEAVEDEMANHGLTTVPHFSKVGPETQVDMLLVREVAGDDRPSPPEAGDESDDVFGLTIGNLPSALSGVESVACSALSMRSSPRCC